MTDTTSRFLLPLILPGQAQKELFHNEALARIDAVLHPAVEDSPSAIPPLAPENGQSWIVAAGGSGAWFGHDMELAAWTEGGWRFVIPQSGMSAWNKSDAVSLRWSGAQWEAALDTDALRIGGVQVVGQRRPSVPSPSGGTVIDNEARSAIASVIATLMSHGLIE